MKVGSDVFILRMTNYVWWCIFSVVNLCLDLFAIARSLHECDHHDLLTGQKRAQTDKYTRIFIWLCYIR